MFVEIIFRLRRSTNARLRGAGGARWAGSKGSYVFSSMIKSLLDATGLQEPGEQDVNTPLGKNLSTTDFCVVGLCRPPAGETVGPDLNADQTIIPLLTLTQCHCFSPYLFHWVKSRWWGLRQIRLNCLHISKWLPSVLLWWVTLPTASGPRKLISQFSGQVWPRLQCSQRLLSLSSWYMDPESISMDSTSISVDGHKF